MRRKIKQIDVNELIDADDINRTSIKKEMRKLYAAINRKLTEGGWSARDMVKWLDERGVSMSVELFRVYLNDLDREHGYQRSTKKFRESSQNTNAFVVSSDQERIIEDDSLKILSTPVSQSNSTDEKDNQTPSSNSAGNKLSLQSKRKAKKFEFNPNRN